MGWINLAATRHRLHTAATRTVDGWELAPGRLPPWPEIVEVVLTGEERLFRRAAQVARRALRELGDLSRPTKEQLPVLVGLGCLRQLAGEDQQSFWMRLAQARRSRFRATGPRHRAWQLLIRRLAGISAAPRSPSRPRRGSVRSLSGWWRRLHRGSLWHVFDLSLCPDHPLWPELSHYVLPLGVLLAREAVRDGEDTDALEFLRYGASPEAHARVVFERIGPPRPWGEEADPDAPQSWFSFDAVELRDNEVYCYYFLSHGGRPAPALTGKSLRFLGHQDLSWRLVETQLTPEVWREVERHRRAGRCLTVLVRDEAESNGSTAHLRRVGRHYGLRLAARDVTQV